MAETLVVRDSDDPWRGVQPRYDKLVFRGLREFHATLGGLPGKPPEIRLGAMSVRRRPLPSEAA